MRVTAFILAILVLIISCMPCSDMHDIAMAKRAYHSVVSKNGSHQQDNGRNDLDLCSPFCHCSCCGGFSVMQAVTIPQRLIVKIQPIYTEYVSADVINISLPVWQPPQLV